MLIRFSQIYNLIKCFLQFIILVMFERVASLRRKRQSLSRNPRHEIVIFNAEDKFSQHCKICKLSQNLIAICDCNFRYHEKCLLNFIKHQMKKALITEGVFNPSSIKCPAPHCQKQIYFIQEERNRYGCENYCEKMNENKCNKHLILIMVLILILGAFLFVTIYVNKEEQNTETLVVFSVFCLLSFIVGVVLVGVIIAFFSKYLQVRQIFLKSIVRPKTGRISDGGSSSSSQENKVYQNVTENFEIYVDVQG